MSCYESRRVTRQSVTKPKPIDRGFRVKTVNTPTWRTPKIVSRFQTWRSKHPIQIMELKSIYSKLFDTITELIHLYK